MILSEIRDYVRDRGQVTLQDIAVHFDTDPEALRSMLAHWIRKGKILRRSVSADCGSSCTQCDPTAVELYVWHENGPLAGIPVVRDLGCER